MLDCAVQHFKDKLACYVGVLFVVRVRDTPLNLHNLTQSASRLMEPVHYTLQQETSRKLFMPLIKCLFGFAIFFIFYCLCGCFTPLLTDMMVIEYMKWEYRHSTPTHYIDIGEGHWYSSNSMIQ